MSKQKKGTSAAAVDVTKTKKRGQMADVWMRLRRNKTAMLGLAIVILLILMVIFAGVLFDYDEVVIKQDITQRLQSPSAAPSERMKWAAISWRGSSTAPECPWAFR